MARSDLSLNEWVVLALVAERPTHGFAISRQLQGDADLGRILTVHRPLVYRALDRVVRAGLAVPQQTEPGDGGPVRTVYGVTEHGRRALDAWMVEPVAHVRDLRIEFLVKLRLTERAARDPSPVISSQRTALADTLDCLTRPTVGMTGSTDVVDLWRYHNALAARSFLVALDEAASTGFSPVGRSEVRSSQGDE